MKSSNKKMIEKIINILLNILIFIFGIVLLISIYTGVQTKILGNDYTDFFGHSIFEVQTGSMADTINPGDWIIVKLTQNVKLNDVVTYKLDGEYITHRVIEAYNGTYITKGDANNAKDDPVDQKQIVGKVVSILANFGILRKTLFNPGVLIALIITLLLFNLLFKKNSKEKNNHSIPDIITNVFSSLLNKVKKQKVYEDDDEHIDILKVENKRIEKQEQGNEEKESELEKTSHYRVISVDSKSTESKTSEEDLEKTSFYRMIPVDLNETDNKQKDINISPDTIDSYKDESELDKTSLYRVISVDAKELDNTLLEIAKNEMEKSGKEDKKKEEVKEEQKEEVEEDKDLTKIDIDLMKELPFKKGKNIIDTSMHIKIQEIEEIINILVKDDSTYINKETIKYLFINNYIDTKYYLSNNTEKKFITRIEKVIKETASKLIKSYNGKDHKHNEIVKRYVNLFLLVAALDQAKDSITDPKAKHEFYKKEILKYYNNWNIKKIESVINSIIKLQKYYIDTLDSFLKNLETTMFSLNFNKLTSKSDMYGLELHHNIPFSKVYSNYIIDKTYTEGIVAEDKMSVLLNLLSLKIVKDMMISNFNRYVLYVPGSLYIKEKKLVKLLSMIDDRYAKECVIILIKFEDIVKNEVIVKKVRKMGYRFAIVFNNETVIEDKKKGNMYIADYIFINKKDINANKILSFIPKDLLSNIIYENMVEKVGDFGSE